MKKKKIFIITLFFLISSCGYQPIYSDKTYSNLNINVTSFKGDEDINRLLKSKLRSYSKQEGKKFYLTVNTSYNKIVLARNSARVVTDYQILIKSNFIVKYNDITKTVTLNEKFNMKNTDDIFEVNKYENIIKQNLVEMIVQNLILEINQIK